MVYTQAKFLLRFGVTALFGPRWPMFKARRALYCQLGRGYGFGVSTLKDAISAYRDYWQGVYSILSP